MKRFSAEGGNCSCCCRDCCCFVFPGAATFPFSQGGPLGFHWEGRRGGGVNPPPPPPPSPSPFKTHPFINPFFFIFNSSHPSSGVVSGVSPRVSRGWGEGGLRGWAWLGSPKGGRGPKCRFFSLRRGRGMRRVSWRQGWSPRRGVLGGYGRLWSNPFWANPFLASPFGQPILANPFLCCVVVGVVVCCWFGPIPPTAGPPKISLFFILPSHFALFVSLWMSSRGILVVF